MKKFFQKNQIFIGIIIAALIIGGFIYFSNRPSQPSPGITPPVSSGEETQEPEGGTGTLECISYVNAGSYIGEHKCVTGKVDNVYTSNKGNNFLNFCSNYKTCPFSAVIFNSDAYKFTSIQGYEGKTIETTGLIKTYQGRAEIIINDPSQIKIK